jgi:exonuclease III
MKLSESAQAMVRDAQGGDDKIVFAENVNKINKKMKRMRRIFLLGDKNIYTFAIDKNPTKDKEEKKRKPIIYRLRRMVRSTSLSFSVRVCVCVSLCRFRSRASAA